MKLLLFLFIAMIGIEIHNESLAFIGAPAIVKETSIKSIEVEDQYQESRLEKMLSKKSTSKNTYPRIAIFGGLILFYAYIFFQRFFYRWIEEKFHIEFPFNDLSEMLFWIMVVFAGLIGLLLLMIV